jgi:cytidylate kinase
MTSVGSALSRTKPLAHPALVPSQPVVIDPMRPIKALLAAKPVIITIDGPAAVGKGTVSKILSRRLGLQILDTGKMYRAVALAALDEKIPPSDAAALVDLIKRARICFDWDDEPPAIFAFEKPQGHRLGTSAVEEVVSKYAGVPEVRKALIDEQRRLAKEHPRLVCDGRDQGTVVFPDAHVKFFLTAPAEVRARRHAMRHGHADMPEDQLASLAVKIRERDETDVRNGALLQPPTAVVLNTAGMTVEQTVDAMETAVAKAFTP